MLNTVSELLNQSIADHRFDSDEKHALHQVLVTLDEDGCRNVRNQAFTLAREKIREGADTMQMMKWLEKVIKLISTSKSTEKVNSRAYFSPGDECRDAIVNLLNSAKQRVDICVFTISDDRITKAILAAYNRGVSVRVISDNDKANDRGSDVYRLKEQGVPVCMDTSPHHMHHKFAVVDQRLINGSFNWTRSASDRNEENIVISDHQQLLGQFIAVFDDLWGQFS